MKDRSRYSFQCKKDFLIHHANDLAYYQFDWSHDVKNVAQFFSHSRAETFLSKEPCELHDQVVLKSNECFGTTATALGILSDKTILTILSAIYRFVMTDKFCT